MTDGSEESRVEHRCLPGLNDGCGLCLHRNDAEFCGMTLLRCGHRERGGFADE